MDLVDERYEGAVFLEPHKDFKACCVGIIEDPDVRLAYSYEKIVDMLMRRDEMTYEEACEFVDFNTARAIPAMGPQKPVLVYENAVEELRSVQQQVQ